MKNTLLVKEIRDMLDDELYDDIKDFAESNPPDVVADFFEALSTNEIIKIFSFIDEDIAAEIYSEFEDDVKAQLTRELPSRELAELLYELPESVHNQIISTLPEEEQLEIKRLIEEIDNEEQIKQEQQFAHIPGIIRDKEGTIHENIRVYRPFNKKLKQINKLEQNTLVTICDPDQEEIDFICSEFKIPADFFDYALDNDERARVEEDGSNKLVIVKIPYLENDIDDMYGTVPLGIIFSGKSIVMVCSKESELVTKLIAKMQKSYTGNLAKDDFVLSVLYDTTQLYLLYLKQINNIIDFTQRNIQDTGRNEDLIKLLNLEKSLVYFTTALKSNEFMAMKLKKVGIIPSSEANEDRIEDIIIESKQGIEMSSIYNNIVSEMMNAFSSLISNKLNNIMKILTLITIVLTIPMLFSSIYGMNIPLWGEKSQMALPTFITVSVVVTSVVVWIFKKKDWF